MEIVILQHGEICFLLAFEPADITGDDIDPQVTPGRWVLRTWGPQSEVEMETARLRHVYKMQD